MNMKEKLKHAIDNSEWGGVCEVYESMFGESIELPSGSSEYLDIGLIKKMATQIINECDLINMPHEPSVKDDSEDAVETHQPPEDEDEVIIEENADEGDTVSTNPQDQQISNQGSWESQIKQNFISSKDFSLPEDDIKGYSDAMKDHGKRKKHQRESYVPQMVKCAKCGLDFDYNKEYPAGMLDNSRGIKCNKCRLIA